jgi:hypothetical protein
LPASAAAATISGVLMEILAHLPALPLAFLPRRWWAAFYRLPVERLVVASGVLTLMIGLGLGLWGFLAFAQNVAGTASEAGLKAPIDSGVTLSTLQGFSAFSFVGFVCFTPLGWFSTYLVVTGLLRAVSAVVGQPFGEPILTGIDAVGTRWSAAAGKARRQRARERLEGRAMPDRLFTGEWAGLTGVDYVVVASRQKQEWTAGTIVATGERFFAIGEPFDMRLPHGVRTAYPLTVLNTGEVMRRAVSYVLPPLEPSTAVRRSSSS